MKVFTVACMTIAALGGLIVITNTVRNVLAEAGAKKEG